LTFAPRSELNPAKIGQICLKRRYLYLYTTFYVFLPISRQSRRGRPDVEKIALLPGGKSCGNCL